MHLHTSFSPCIFHCHFYTFTCFYHFCLCCWNVLQNDMLVCDTWILHNLGKLYNLLNSCTWTWFDLIKLFTDTCTYASFSLHKPKKLKERMNLISLLVHQHLIWIILLIKCKHVMLRIGFFPLSICLLTNSEDIQIWLDSTHVILLCYIRIVAKRYETLE